MQHTSWSAYCTAPPHNRADAIGSGVDDVQLYAIKYMLLLDCDRAPCLRSCLRACVCRLYRMQWFTIPSKPLPECSAVGLNPSFLTGRQKTATLTETGRLLQLGCHVSECACNVLFDTRLIHGQHTVPVHRELGLRSLLLRVAQSCIVSLIPHKK